VDTTQAPEIVEIELSACEPESLLTRPTPAGVWLRLNTLEEQHTGWPEVAIKGEKVAVQQFVADNWGDDAVEDVWGDES
jgi:hypothetical protein